MTTAKEKLTAKIAALTTEQLLEISTRMALHTTNEAIIVCAKVEGELSHRLTEEEFCAHCDVIESLMDLAA